MKPSHNHPPRGHVRRILSLMLTLTTLFMLTVFAPPAHALSAGDILYLKAEGQVIESATAIFYNAEGVPVGEAMGEDMSDQDLDGIFSVEIPDGATQVCFPMVTFQDSFSTDNGLSRMDFSQAAENTYDLVSGEWSVFGSLPTPDEPESDTHETTDTNGNVSYTDKCLRAKDEIRV